MAASINPSSQIVTIPTDLQFKETSDLQKVLENAAIATRVDSIQRTYYTIDIGKAMKQLTMVGDLLQVAYAGCKGFKSSKEVISILADYQTLVKDSNLATHTFVGACLSALSNHRVAIRIAETGKIDKSLAVISRCADLANKMADVAGGLVAQAEKLRDFAKAALLSATEDEHVSSENRKKITQSIQEQEANEARLKANRNSLEEAIQAEKEKEAQAAKEADRARSRAFTASWVSGATGGLLFKGTVESLHRQEEASLAKESQIAARRAALQKEEREQNGQLAECVSRIKSLTGESNELQRAITSLELSIKVLGKVKIIFENTRMFWKGVEAHCKHLTDISHLQDWVDAELKDEFISDLHYSAIKWITLGKINFIASEAIGRVDGRVDTIMSNLPNKAEAIALVQSTATKILADIEVENLQLTSGENV